MHAAYGNAMSIHVHLAGHRHFHAGLGQVIGARTSVSKTPQAWTVGPRAFEMSCLGESSVNQGLYTCAAACDAESNYSLHTLDSSNDTRKGDNNGEGQENRLACLPLPERGQQERVEGVYYSEIHAVGVPRGVWDEGTNLQKTELF